ncbi:MAG TPA: tRNA dimethylallyltransferase, partial [Chthoniobacterales bacterium]|nr:tRNA dimethylallyltransferase [Chthoniobacterales bacterium]
ERLRIADSAALEQIDLKNKRRVTRAIEIVETSGQPLAHFRSTPRAYVPGLLLVRERENLRGRIEYNVRAMFDRGVVEEVNALGESVGLTAARAIGFQEIQALLRGEISQADCEADIVTATRQYAKRQLTWFRNQTKFSVLDLTDSQHPSQVVDHALGVLDSE